MGNQRGEIGTIIVISAFVLVSVATAVTSFISQSSDLSFTTSTRASEQLRPCAEFNSSWVSTPDKYKWVAMCNRACEQNSDCPQSKDGYTYGPSSAWCYGGFTEGSRCLQLTYDGPRQGGETAPPPNEDAGSSCYVGKFCNVPECGGANAGKCPLCDGGWCNGGSCATCGNSKPVYSGGTDSGSQQPSPTSAPAPTTPPAQPTSSSNTGSTDTSTNTGTTGSTGTSGNTGSSGTTGNTGTSGTSGTTVGEPDPVVDCSQYTGRTQSKKTQCASSGCIACGDGTTCAETQSACPQEAAPQAAEKCEVEITTVDYDTGNPAGQIDVLVKQNNLESEGTTGVFGGKFKTGRDFETGRVTVSLQSRTGEYEDMKTGFSITAPDACKKTIRVERKEAVPSPVTSPPAGGGSVAPSPGEDAPATTCQISVTVKSTDGSPVPGARISYIINGVLQEGRNSEGDPDKLTNAQGVSRTSRQYDPTKMRVAVYSETHESVNNTALPEGSCAIEFTVAPKETPDNDTRPNCQYACLSSCTAPVYTSVPSQKCSVQGAVCCQQDASKKVLEVKNNSTNDITIKKICATTGWLCDYEVKNLNYVLKKNNSSPAYVNTEILNRYCASGIPGNQPFTMKVFFTIGNSSTQYSIENRVDCVRPTQIMTFSP